MKTSFLKRSLLLTVLLAALSVIAGSVYAADVTVPTNGSPNNVNAGTITFDPTLTADTGDDLGNTFTVNSGVLGTPYYTGVNLDHGLGEIAAGLENVQGSSLDLANGIGSGNAGIAPRTGARASWSGRYLVNLDGDDLVVTENGTAGGVEYFVIRVKPVNGAESNFYYSPADAFQDADSADAVMGGGVTTNALAAPSANPLSFNEDTGDFLTAIDLSDLGYSTCTTFEYVELHEMLTTDLFDASGYGYVGAGTTAHYRPTTLDQIPNPSLPLFYDADIGFIFAKSPANLVNIPNPALEITTTDAGSGIIFTDACTQVSEGATVGDQFAFRLSGYPANDVIVTFTVDNAAEILIDNGYTAGLSFSNSFSVTFENVDTGTAKPDWNQWVIVNVQGVFDNLDETDPELHAVNISTTSGDPTFTGLGVSMSVLVYDPGINLSSYTPDPLPEGSSTSYTVTLNSPPGLRNATEMETVRLQLTGYNSRLITPSPLNLYFTRADWNTPQTVSVLAIDDVDNRGVTYNTSIAHIPSSNVQNPTYDSRYGGGGTNIALVRLRIAIADNDLVDGTPLTQAEIDARLLALWLDIAPVGSQIAEGTSVTALGVRLAGQPLPGEVVVIAVNSLPGVVVTPAQLVFNEFNWDVYQAVAITPAVDATAQGVYTIPVQVAVTDGTTFAEVIGAVDAVEITVTDGAVTNVVPELSAQPFVPAAEGGSSSEGSSSE